MIYLKLKLALDSRAWGPGARKGCIVVESENQRRKHIVPWSSCGARGAKHAVLSLSFGGSGRHDAVQSSSLRTRVLKYFTVVEFGGARC